jgi:CRP/FNR family transcriptional regulator, cyclic AMP receptor protein
MFQTLPASQIFLRSQMWFPSLGTQQKAAVEAAAILIEGSRGDLMLHANEPAEGWYGVVSGLVKLQSVPSPGRQSVFLGIPAGQWFGEGTVLKKERRRYEVLALRDTVMLCLPNATFQALYETHIPFNHALLQQMNVRVGQAMAEIETTRSGTTRQRVALHLSRLFWHGIHKLDLSQEELGALVGLSRQTVNGALHDLENMGLVSLRKGRISVLAEDRLVAFVTGIDTPER